MATKRQKQQYFWPVMIVVFVLSVVAGLLLIPKERASSAPPSGVPEVQAMAPVVIDTVAIKRNQEAMRQLIQAHPDTVVRVWADREIREGRLYLNFDKSVTGGAANVAAFGVMDIDGQAVPMLMVDPDLICSNDMPLVEKRLVVRHELEHYRQWLAHRFPEETFRPRPQAVQFTETDVRCMVIAESEAYEVEGKLAKRLNARSSYGIVQAYIDGGYVRMMHELVTEYAAVPLVQAQQRTLQAVADSLIATRHT